MESWRQKALQKLKSRYSCRQFSSRPLENEVLDEIIEVGLRAASGGNLQPVSMILIRDQERKDKIQALCKQGFIRDADTLVIYLLDYYRLNRWAKVQCAPFGRPNSFNDFIIAMEDVMCVAQSMECAATLLGVGSVYIGTVNYYYDQLKELLDLPELTIPVLMTCFGYPRSETAENHLQGHLRKKLTEKLVVHREKYQRLSDEDVDTYIVKEKYGSWMQHLEGEHLEKYKKLLYDVAKTVNGKEYAEQVVARIEEQQGINRAQYRLGYHYNPVKLRARNKPILNFYRKQGFNFWTEDNK